MLHLAIENGNPGEWEDLKGCVLDEIECVSRETGIIDVLTLATDSSLRINTFSTDKWAGWLNHGGQFMEVPSCAVRTPTEIECMMRGRQNEVFVINSRDGKWTDFDSFEHTLFSPVGCIARSETYTTCFATGLDLQMWKAHAVWGKGWKIWEELGDLVKGRPSVTSWDEDRIDVFTLGVKTNSVMQKTLIGQWWKDWVDLEGVFVSEPDCVTTGAGKLHCFAVGLGLYLYRNSYTESDWTGWIKSFGESLLETPSCVVSNTDEVTCVGRKVSQEVVLIVYEFGDVGA